MLGFGVMGAKERGAGSDSEEARLDPGSWMRHPRKTPDSLPLQPLLFKSGSQDPSTRKAAIVIFSFYHK